MDNLLLIRFSILNKLSYNSSNNILESVVIIIPSLDPATILQSNNKLYICLSSKLSRSLSKLFINSKYFFNDSLSAWDNILFNLFL